MHHTIILLLCIAVLVSSLLLKCDETGLYLFGLKVPMRCFLFHTFGIKCALCGLTRSFCSLALGDFLTSLRLHFLGPPIFAFICLQIPYRIWSLIVSPKKMSKKLMKTNLSLAATLLMAILVNWLVYLGGLIL